MTKDQVNRYINRTIEIIYCSTKGDLSKRRIRIIGIKNKQIYSYCYLRKQQRCFLMDGVLAWQPLIRDWQNKPQT